MITLPTPVQDKQSSKIATTFRFRNEEERKLHAWVNAQVEDYIDYARPAREIGSDAIQGYMSTVFQSHNRRDRSDITFPLLHATIYSRMAIEAARAPKMHFRARTQADESNMQWIEKSITDAQKGGYNKPSADHVYLEQTFDKSLLGVGPSMVNFEFQTRLMHVQDPRTGRWVEKTAVVYDDIREKSIDFFNFGVSRDMKPGMFDGSGAYYDEFYDETTLFDKFGNNPFFYNVTKDKIPNGDWFMGAADGLKKPRMWNNIYRVRYFWHLPSDLFFVQINGIPVRQDYILDYGDPMNPKKMIPIATIHNDISFETSGQGAMSKFAIQNNRFYTEQSSVNTNKNFWSKSEALLVKPMVAAKNSFGRAAIDWLRAANVHFVMGPSGVIERINKGRLYGIEPIKLDAGDFNTKSLVQGSSFLRDFQEGDAYLSKQMHAALGRDITRVARDNPPQATVAAMERELEKSREQQNANYNASGGLLRKAWLYYILVKQYYPLPRKVRINNRGQIEDIDEYRILRDRDGNPVLQLQPKKIDIGFPVVETFTDEKIKMPDSSGKMVDAMTQKYKLVLPGHSSAEGKDAQSFITLREDHFAVQEDPEIVIDPDFAFKEESAMMQAVAVEKLQALQPFFTMNNNGQPVLPPEAINYVLENTAVAFGWDVERLLGVLDANSADRKQEDERAPEPYVGAEQLGPMTPSSETAQRTPTSGMTQQSPTGSPPSAGNAVNQNAALASMTTP